MTFKSVAKAEASARESARQRVQKAIAWGKLIKPATCPRCGDTPKTTAVGASQMCAYWPNGYHKPLDVAFHCYSCARHGPDRNRSPAPAPRPSVDAGKVLIKLWMPHAQTTPPTNMRPNEIFITGRRVMRDGVSVDLPPFLRRLLLILAARQHAITPVAEIIDLLWGDDINGGPETAQKQVEVGMMALRDAGAALGFRIETMHNRGYILAPVVRRELEAAA